MKIVKKYFLWAILSFPLIGAITQAINIPYTEKEFDQLMHVSGEFGVRLLIISLMITPLSMIFKRTKFAKWFPSAVRRLAATPYAEWYASDNL